MNKIIAKNSIQHEYSYLINLYTDIVGFPIVTSTFNHISQEDKDQLIVASKVLEAELRRIIPQLGDKEIK